MQNKFDSISPQDPVDKLINRGGTSLVYKRTNPLTGKFVVVKKIPRRYEDIYENEIACYTLLQEYPHEHILKFLGTEVTIDEYHITLEYMRHGELWDLFARHQFNIPIEQIHRIFVDMISALHHLHQHHFLHRDLKPENLLFDEHDVVKIADFGFAAKIEEGTAYKPTQIQGTPEYLAPEVFNLKEYTEKTDIYATGIILWVLYAKISPFDILPFNAITEPVQKVKAIVEHVHKGNRLSLEQIPITAHFFLNQLWHQDPNKRPSTTSILTMLDSPFMESPVGLQKSHVKQDMAMLPSANDSILSESKFSQSDNDKSSSNSLYISPVDTSVTTSVCASLIDNSDHSLTLSASTNSSTTIPMLHQPSSNFSDIPFSMSKNLKLTVWNKKVSSPCKLNIALENNENVDYCL